MDLILVFRLGEELYGLDVASIQEIVESPDLNFIPRAPAIYLGALNFHGTILPVLDLGGHLGFAAGERDQRVIVLAPEICGLALAVTSILRIVPLEAEALLPVQGEDQRGTHIRAVFNRDGDMINLLDTASLRSSLETF